MGRVWVGTKQLFPIQPVIKSPIIIEDFFLGGGDISHIFQSPFSESGAVFHFLYLINE